jgi:hypothetical protein
MSARTEEIRRSNRTMFLPPTLPREAVDIVNGRNPTDIQNGAENALVKQNDTLVWLTASIKSGRFLTI